MQEEKERSRAAVVARMGEGNRMGESFWRRKGATPPPHHVARPVAVFLTGLRATWSGHSSACLNSVAMTGVGAVWDLFFGWCTV